MHASGSSQRGNAPWRRTFSALLTAAFALVHNSAAASVTALSAPVSSPTQVRLVTIHPHDVDAFTEGLFFHNGALVESTGLNEKSFIRQYALAATGDAQVAADADGSRASKRIQKEFRFDPSLFGEGVAAIGGTLYALTYKAKKILELSMSNFTLLNTHPIKTSTGEGWGMTTDGTLLIVSDGSSRIQFYDPRSSDFKLMRSIDVRQQDGNLISNVNELEFLPEKNEILANVWYTNHILRINATDGSVLEVLDLTWVRNMASNLQTPAILSSRWRNDAVMNGIAFDPITNHVYVTGKLWDSIFELELSYLHHNRKQKHAKSIDADL
uniref:Glutamine cyclotransferase n=1 Tax=Globisporangium ultimum (strain ATCC 200006 / CBS 805.95 / DAOM BR144) TaxID=431595 RepID=K3W773_GLOUD